MLFFQLFKALNHFRYHYVHVLNVCKCSSFHFNETKFWCLCNNGNKGISFYSIPEVTNKNWFHISQSNRTSNIIIVIILIPAGAENIQENQQDIILDIYFGVQQRSHRLSWDKLDYKCTGYWSGDIAVTCKYVTLLACPQCSLWKFRQ